ncbi:carbohydrate ABC transporter permease [Pseudonocardia halophobica]|uniref:Sugar ABC transporter permease n=1 Tax=Pseudonocardia halophobica TaxID=29401 RepID=A0A9W6L295_9PSEU|nr:carbohydrate ABC transporter permease [Pseudonocardia halophobica]GLL11703.1 sugar ABC transporter permease [Pseudonocardia halophobica]
MTARRVLGYGGAVLLAGWVLVPIWFVVVGAFSTADAVYSYPLAAWPDWSLESMRFFVTSAGVPQALLSSVIVAVLTGVVTLLLAAPAGYALARFVFPGADAYRLAVLSTRAFPVVVLSIPLAVFFLQWGIYDTVWGVALMHTALALPFVVLMVSAVFAGVPVDLEEAAQVFGCSRFGAFRRAVVPNAAPGLAAAATFAVLLSYNEVFAASILTLQQPTLPVFVLTGLTQAPLPFRYAGALFLLAPAFLFILLIRRRLLGVGGGPTLR